MGLFRTQESREKWLRFLAFELIAGILISVAGYYLVLVPVLGMAPGQPVFWEYAALLGLDVLLSFMLAFAIGYLLILAKYIGKPMKVTEKDKNFNMNNSKEAGRRQKGKSKRR